MIDLKKAYLVLSNGRIFEGEHFGADIDSIGELVFTTGLSGYIETLTDPSCYGQIVMQTFPLIGNYGIIEEDFEGECGVKGLVVREWCNTPSNFRCEYNLDEFLKRSGVPGISGIDTRELMRILRTEGIMNAAICSEVPENLDAIKAYAITNAVKDVTCDEISVYPLDTKPEHRVTLIDYGAKGNIVKELQKRGCLVTEVPAFTNAEDILATNPDGIMLSNGPGDPFELSYCIEQIKLLKGKAAMFGICLGHQLLALANGAKTCKMRHGHRGSNQPVRCTESGRTYITCQNHGFEVDFSTLKVDAVQSFVNANDGTCEGIEYPDIKAFSVQFHPEACAGPTDTSFLFDHFVSLMGGERVAAE